MFFRGAGASFLDAFTNNTEPNVVGGIVRGVKMPGTRTHTVRPGFPAASPVNPFGPVEPALRVYAFPAPVRLQIVKTPLEHVPG